MKTKIPKVKGDWVEVKNDARFTMGIFHAWTRMVLMLW